MIDLAYIVRPGDNNEELRHSLRSVEANVTGFRNIWIAGTVPTWVRNVRALPIPPKPEKFANQRQSVTALCEAPGVADTIVIFNDDHFVTDPIDASSVPVFHLGPAEDLAARLIDNHAIDPRNRWLRAVRKTASWVEQQGHPNALAYEAHTPLPFRTAALRDALAAYPAERILCYPELYALAGAGDVGVSAGNCKVARLADAELRAKMELSMPYLSSNDDTFAAGAIGDHIRATFPTPSRYETEGA